MFRSSGPAAFLVEKQEERLAWRQGESRVVAASHSLELAAALIVNQEEEPVWRLAGIQVDAALPVMSSTLPLNLSEFQSQPVVLSLQIYYHTELQSGSHGRCAFHHSTILLQAYSVQSDGTPDDILHDRPVLQRNDRPGGIPLDPTTLHAYRLHDVQTIHAAVPIRSRMTSLTMDHSER